MEIKGKYLYFNCGLLPDGSDKIVPIARTDAVGRTQLLIAFRDKLQSMCYWYSQGKKHGECKMMNGAQHPCTFCELVEELDGVLR